jgi:triosephosphate isomerase
MRTPVIAGNWKMHKTPTQTALVFHAFLARSREVRGTLVFFPPAISIAAAAKALGSRKDIRLGVQNIHWKQEGAFTGEISARMAVDAGARVALVGHSERRHIFVETDEEVAAKVGAALESGLDVVACVGETLDERRAGNVDDVILRQLRAALTHLTQEHAGRVAIAYEPVWAIGTGINATPEDASAAHATLRSELRARLGEGAGQIPILYGGSVKPDNARELLAAAEVDGLLIGGASLDPVGFGEICDMAGV